MQATAGRRRCGKIQGRYSGAEGRECCQSIAATLCRGCRDERGDDAPANRSARRRWGRSWELQEGAWTCATIAPNGGGEALVRAIYQHERIEG